MNDPVLLCSDLDRTILPNGPQPESPLARPLLRRFATRPQVRLAYVSGRHQALLAAAIDNYQIPLPRYAIGDVGSTIYQIIDTVWHPWEAWQREIAPDWAGNSRDDLARLLTGLPQLSMQEPEKQNTFKLSYYAPRDLEPVTMVRAIEERLLSRRIRANVIWSIDELKDCGLIDVLPQSANKLHAIRFLMERQGLGAEHTVFAGDSGNDLDVLTSGLNATLVANASPAVRNEATRALAARGLANTLYCARGDFLGMNGNYAAGVLEGVAHFIPAAAAWLGDDAQSL